MEDTASCRPLSQGDRWALASVHRPLPPALQVPRVFLSLQTCPHVPSSPSTSLPWPPRPHLPVHVTPPQPDSTHWADGDTAAREGARVTQSDLALGWVQSGVPCPKPETNPENKTQGVQEGAAQGPGWRLPRPRRSALCSTHCASGSLQTRLASSQQPRPRAHRPPACRAAEEGQLRKP